MFRVLSMTVFIVALVSVSALAATPTTYLYIFPVIAKNAGMAGSDWRTEVCATNINYDLTLPVEFLFVQEGNSYYFEERIPPSSTMCFDDIVGEGLGLDSWQGTLMVGVDPKAHINDKKYRFVARARVYNSTSSGTTGLNVTPEIELFGIGDPISFHYTDGSDGALFVAGASGVQNYGQPGASGQRTSIGYFNLGYDPYSRDFTVWQEVEFLVFDRYGKLLYKKERLVAPQKQAQFTLPSNLEVRGGSVQMHLLGDPYDYWGLPSEEFFAYITVTDNKSGDGTYSPFRMIYDGGNNYKKNETEHTDYREMMQKLLETSQMIRRPSGRVTPE